MQDRTHDWLDGAPAQSFLPLLHQPIFNPSNDGILAFNAIARR
jgi:hypothetical protein